MRANLKGINTVTAKLAGGKIATYYYHRATGTRLEGEPGSPEFIASIAEAAAKAPSRDAGTLSGLIRLFEGTVRWSKLAESTKTEYRRIFKFWDGKYGTVPLAGLEAKTFRQRVLAWHADFSKTKPREADNRVTILARVLSWGAKDGPLKINVLDGFERAYSSDRADKIWLTEHVDAFMAVAGPEMQLALALALHTGQRQADIRRMAWTNYDGVRIVSRQGKSARNGKPARIVTIPCTKALKATLDGMQRRGALIMTTKTGRAFQKRYLAEKWEETAKAAGVVDLHFHDLRGTTVTMLFEAGCTVAEAASITGHTLARAQEILDKYLARTSTMAANAIAKFENVLAIEDAKRLAKGYAPDGAK